MAQSYTHARVEWAHTSKHGTVALRVGEQVSNWCQFQNDKALLIAVCAGLQGRTVDFETDGVSGGHWQNVHITAVH